MYLWYFYHIVLIAISEGFHDGPWTLKLCMALVWTKHGLTTTHGRFSNESGGIKATMPRNDGPLQLLWGCNVVKPKKTIPKVTIFVDDIFTSPKFARFMAEMGFPTWNRTHLWFLMHKKLWPCLVGKMVRWNHGSLGVSQGFSGFPYTIRWWQKSKQIVPCARPGRGLGEGGCGSNSRFCWVFQGTLVDDFLNRILWKLWEIHWFSAAIFFVTKVSFELHC